MNPFVRKAVKLFGFRKFRLDAFPVRVVVTGIEHSGTTLLSQLLQQHPGLNSGFECGFLLADCPEDFKNVHPWHEWMQEPVDVHQWGVSPWDMERICTSESWEEAYRRLIRYSPVFAEKRKQQVCDKTPRYMSCLDAVLDKLPVYVPCIVIEKNIENLWRSHKKRGSSLDDFCSVYTLYNNGLRRALRKHGNRIHRVGYEDLCMDPDLQLRKIFAVLKLSYEAEYGSNRSREIRGYMQNQQGRGEPFPEVERETLDRLKDEFSDLLR